MVSCGPGRTDLSGQLGLQLLEGNLQRAGALGLEMLGLELQVSALVIDGHPTRAITCKPFSGRNATVAPGCATSPPQLSGAVFHGEVKMTGLGRAIV